MLALYRDDFNALLGGLRDVLSSNLGMRVLQVRDSRPPRGVCVCLCGGMGGLTLRRALQCVPLFKGLSNEEREEVFSALQVSIGRTSCAR